MQPHRRSPPDRAKALRQAGVSCVRVVVRAVPDTPNPTDPNPALNSLVLVEVDTPDHRKTRWSFRAGHPLPSNSVIISSIGKTLPGLTVKRPFESP